MCVCVCVCVIVCDLATSKRSGFGLSRAIAPDRKNVYVYTQAAASFLTRVPDTKVKTVSEPIAG